MAVFSAAIVLVDIKMENKEKLSTQNHQILGTVSLPETQKFHTPSLGQCAFHRQSF